MKWFSTLQKTCTSHRHKLVEDSPSEISGGWLESAGDCDLKTFVRVGSSVPPCGPQQVTLLRCSGGRLSLSLWLLPSA